MTDPKKRIKKIRDNLKRIKEIRDNLVLVERFLNIIVKRTIELEIWVDKILWEAEDDRPKSADS